MTDSIKVNVTLDSKQLAELELIPLGENNWSARCAVLLPEGLKMVRMGVPEYPQDMNVMGLILSVVSRLPEEAFFGPIDPPNLRNRSGMARWPLRWRSIHRASSTEE